MIRLTARQGNSPQKRSGLSSWRHGEVLYHIYPLSFSDSNGDGYGDINGIIERLDYLAPDTPEGLGVAALWLSPIFRSPMKDWGYDVADYRSIDPKFGTMADFERLVSAVHQRGMRILLDFVPNHTSSEHEWFTAARRSRMNPKRDWYIWADPKADGTEPNNWLSRFGGPAWTYDEGSGQYYMHSFLPSQPDLNWRNPEVRREMEAVLTYWLEKGVDGFRTDAVMSLLKDQHLRDNPLNPAWREGESDPADRYLQVYSAMSEGLGGILGSFCEVIEKAGDQNLLLSEAYLDIPGMSRLYRACDKHPVHAPFNFNLIHLPWSASAYRSFVDAYEDSLGPEDLPNYVLGNHDQHRLVSRLGAERARLAAMMQLTLRGLAVLYYGDELGMADAVLDDAYLRDPWSLRIGSRTASRDAERAPMPWDKTDHAGFSTVDPWLPLISGAHDASVVAQSGRADSSLNLYRHLIHLRRQLPALADGSYGAIEHDEPNVFAYTRRSGRSTVVVVLNFSPELVDLELAFTGRCIAATHDIEGDGGLYDGGPLRLRPYEGKVFEAVAG